MIHYIDTLFEQYINEETPVTMKPENLYEPDCIRTHSGHYLNVFEPNPAHICIEDIAHALSHQPRWAGHTPVFYSVAAHSLHVAHRSQAADKLCALMHDASEAYLSDMPTPIKERMPIYKEAEHRLMEVIAEKFGFAWPMPQAVKDIDKIVLEWEWQHIKLGGNPSYAIWTPEENKRNFLTRFEEYSKLI